MLHQRVYSEYAIKENVKKKCKTDYDDVHQLNRRVPDDYDYDYGYDDGDGDDDESAVKRTRARATKNQLLNREIRKQTRNTNENTFGGAVPANDDRFLMADATSSGSGDRQQ